MLILLTEEACKQITYLNQVTIIYVFYFINHLFGWDTGAVLTTLAMKAVDGD